MIRIARRLKWESAWAGIIALLAVMAGGCLPLEVSWLPDSSGFIYPEVADRRFTKITLKHYDLGTRKEQVIVQDAGTAFPGVSHDGQMFAEARVIGPGNQPPFVLELVIRDLAGKVLEKLPPVKLVGDFRKLEGDDERRRGGTTAAFFAPDDQKLVSFVQANDEESGIVLYDRKAGKAIRVPDRFPLCVAGSPIRSDGAGVLALKSWHELVFIDWNGKERAIAGGGLPEDLVWTRPCPQSRWEGRIAILEGPKNTALIDTEKLTLTIKPRPARLLNADEVVHSRYAFADGTELRWISDTGNVLRLEILKEKEDAARVLVTELDPITPLGGRPTITTITASPDGKLAAVRHSVSRDYRPGNTILVINAAGEILHEVKQADPGAPAEPPRPVNPAPAPVPPAPAGPSPEDRRRAAQDDLTAARSALDKAKSQATAGLSANPECVRLKTEADRTELALNALRARSDTASSDLAAASRAWIAAKGDLSQYLNTAAATDPVASAAAKAVKEKTAAVNAMK